MSAIPSVTISSNRLEDLPLLIGTEASIQGGAQEGANLRR
jgi:hypothetical protein